MTEKTINLGCAKINIKRDTHHYAPWHVINPRLLNPIPEGAKTYKLTPSVTLFFKHRCCQNLNFGWRQIKTKPKKPKEKIMYKSENRSAGKSMSFWQKTAVFLTEADYDITRFFTYNVHPRYRSYTPSASTPGGKLKASFQKQNRMEKENRNTFLMNLGEAWDTFIIRLRDDGSSEAKKRANGMRAARRKSNTAFFQKQRRTRTLVPMPAPERVPTIIENVIPNAPPLAQPPRNPEYKEGTTINNYNFNITCSVS